MTMCTIPSRHPHQADPGLLICDRHLQELGAWLRDVEQEAVLLDARPSLAIDWNRGAQGGLASEQSPVRLDAAVLADRRRGTGHIADEQVDETALDDTPSVFETLHTWATEVRQDCPRLKRHTAMAPERMDVHSERRLLTLHLDWVAAQEWVPDFRAQLRALREQLKAVNGTADPKPLHGRCPRFDDAGNECGGRLWPATPVHSSGGPAVPDTAAVTCDRDPQHTWKGVHLARLHFILQDAQQKGTRS